MNDSSKPNDSKNQQGMSAIELLFTLATLGATVVVAGVTVKRPAIYGD
jgi:hypothetical protein